MTDQMMSSVQLVFTAPNRGFRTTQFLVQLYRVTDQSDSPSTDYSTV